VSHGAKVAAVGVVLLLVPVLVVVCGVAGCSGLLVAELTWSTPAPATIQGRWWERTIEVVRWDRVERRARCDDVPVGAEIIERTRSSSAAAGRIPRRHRSRAPGPRSTWWCTFRITEWTEEPPRIASGTTARRTWPAAPSPGACPSPPPLGCRREASRDEALLLELVRPGGGPVRCEVPEATWDAAAVGRTVLMPVSVLVGRPRCDRLRLDSPPTPG
jgi:hypothetical protein